MRLGYLAAIAFAGGVEATPCCHDPPCTFRDVLHVGDADVVDLNGDLSELTSDEKFKEDDPCYASMILTDPACAFTSEAQFRGGSYFIDVPLDLLGDVVKSYGLSLGFQSLSDGFRCAYPATPKAP